MGKDNRAEARVKMENEKKHSHEGWFDPHPGEDLTSDMGPPCDQEPPKPPVDEKVMLLTETPARPGQKKNISDEVEFRPGP